MIVHSLFRVAYKKTVLSAKRPAIGIIIMPFLAYKQFTPSGLKLVFHFIGLSNLSFSAFTP